MIPLCFPGARQDYLCPLHAWVPAGNMPTPGHQNPWQHPPASLGILASEAGRERSLFSISHEPSWGRLSEPPADVPFPDQLLYNRLVPVLAHRCPGARG